MLKRLKYVILLASISISICLMSNTYSRYIADTTGNVDMLFAKWQILINNSDITSNSNSTMTFVPTIEPNENVASNKIAPSSKGYFDIDIDPTNVDVSFKYDITLSIENNSITDLMITQYSIVPNNYEEGTTLEKFDIENNIISDSLYFDNNTKDFSFEPFTIRIYFEWFEGSKTIINENDIEEVQTETMDDEADTTIGLSAAEEDITFNVNADISFEQIVGTNTEIENTSEN